MPRSRYLYIRAVGQPLDMAAVGTHPVQIEAGVVTLRDKDDSASVRRPDWHSILFVIKRQASQRVARPFIRPQVITLPVIYFYCQFLSVRREVGIIPNRTFRPQR